MLRSAERIRAIYYIILGVDSSSCDRIK